MRHIVSTAILLASLFQQRDATELQGKWTAVDSSNGAHLFKCVLSIDGLKFTKTCGKNTREGTVVIDEKARPRQIDIIVGESIEPCIYRIVSGKLEIWGPPAGSTRRPAEFGGKDDRFEIYASTQN